MEIYFRGSICSRTLGNWYSLQEQTLALKQVLPLFKEYKAIVLGDREFCSLRLGKLAQRNGRIFLLEAQKKLLYRNRKFNRATVRSIRNSTRNFIIVSRRESQKNTSRSRI